MTYRPNSNNIIFYRGRGLKRGKNVQVRFNNRTGCRQIVSCNKCKVINKSPSFIKVGNTVYKLDFQGSNIDDKNIGNAIYAYNLNYNSKYKR